MTWGPGKYDDECTAVREQTRAAAVLLCIVNGIKGSGFSLQTLGNPAGMELLADLPEVLRNLAKQIEESRGEHGAEN